MSRLRPCRERQQALARIHPARTRPSRTLASFIGIDGTNTTLNSGRIQINLKPLEERNITAGDVIRRLQPELAKVEGITLFMQPVQDLDRRRPREPHAISIYARSCPTRRS